MHNHIDRGVQCHGRRWRDNNHTVGSAPSTALAGVGSELLASRRWCTPLSPALSACTDRRGNVIHMRHAMSGLPNDAAAPSIWTR